MKTSDNYLIKLSEIVAAIETSVSLVGVNDTNHGKRVGCIAYQIGFELGFSKPDLQELFTFGMLHDIGVSSSQVYQNLQFDIEWEQVQKHCELGYHLLNLFDPLSNYALPVLYHHTRWSDLQYLPLTPRETTMINIVYLAEQIDSLCAGHYESDILLRTNHITDVISHKVDIYYSPDVLNAFLSIKDSEAFWILLQNRHVTQFAWDMIQEDTKPIAISMKQLKQFAHLLAYLIDQKSAFAKRHSFHVAELAKFVGQRYGLSELQCQKIEVAALVHDLGVLRIPDTVLRKNEPLTPLEQAIMRQHSYETYEILRHIHGLEEIALWAAFHHEHLNGNGYPFHRTGYRLPIEARIIAVCDVFQAFAEKRPYRQNFTIEHILTVLHDMTTIGKLDRSIVALIKEHQQMCYAIATGSYDTALNNDEHPEIDAPIIPSSDT